jgi:hypothetical protein
MQDSTRTITPDATVINLLTASLEDVGNQFQIAQQEIARDIDYALRRLRSEGISFVTKTMPNFGKHLDGCLQNRHFSPFTAFKKARNGALPLFLRGLTKRVFAADGTLQDNPCIDAIRYLRQLAFTFYKLEMDYPEELVDECIRSFVDTDKQLIQCDQILPDKASIIYEAQRLVSRIFRDFDPGDITPRPGPGQSAERRPRWERYEPHVRYRQIDSVLPYNRYFILGGTHLLATARSLRRLPVVTLGESRLALVPKDSRGPRIICMESCEYMWFQQGLGRAVMRHVEMNQLTAGHVNFTDQTVNGRLALHGSRTGIHATLDMKEASDRISRNLVEILFQDVPKLRDCLLALSTKRIRLPSGDLMETRKFAPMGSALCFPIMSVVHFVLMLAALKHKYPRRKYKALAEDIYVYGDDLICRTEDASLFMSDLPQFGLMFNEAKSCTKGNFRESCGVDAYNGIDVTPQRVKRIRFEKRNSSHIQKAFAMFHGFFDRGMWRTAKIWRELIESTWGNFPCVTSRSPALGWVVPRDKIFLANQGRWRQSFQHACTGFGDQVPDSLKAVGRPSHSYWLRARCVSIKPFASAAPGWHGLFRWFIERSESNRTPGWRDRLYPTDRESISFSQRGQTKIVWRRIPSFGL